MTEMKTPDRLVEWEMDPRRACQETIRTEEHNLAQIYFMRAGHALAFTMGDQHARQQVEILDNSERRVLRRLEMARLALAQLERSEGGS